MTDELLAPTGAYPFSYFVVLVATSMNDSEGVPIPSGRLKNLGGVTPYHPRPFAAFRVTPHTFNHTLAQSNLDVEHVLRVVYEENDEIVVVTLYPGRRRRYED